MFKAGEINQPMLEACADWYAVNSAYLSDLYIPSFHFTVPTSALNMDLADNERLAFDCAQAYVSSASNSIELLVSTDFNGTNVLAAHWTSVPFTKPPLNYDTNFTFFSSGIIDLSAFTGNIYLAFKVKGSGTNTSLDGTYEIDNIRLFNKK